MEHWECLPADEQKVEALASALGWPRALARTLYLRGVSRPDEVDGFLKPRLSGLPDPFVFPGMRRAVDRIWKAVDAGEQIVVFGDYDVDGVSSTALMLRVLSGLGARVDFFLPHRIEDGYGLGVDPVNRCIQDKGARLILTVDCGTGSVEAVRAACEQGVDVIVTDHHACTGAPAQAYIVLNPQIENLPEWKVLCGVGMAFMLSFALLKAGREQGRSSAAEFNLKGFLDLVALGTVADIVPLRGVNRILVRAGLKEMESTQNPGLQALMAVAGIRPPLESSHIGFGLGPRLNAAGRLDTAETALQLLLEDEISPCRSIAQTLDAVNTERRKIEKEMLEEAQASFMADFDVSRDFVVVVAGDGWNPGVAGIVAARIMQQTYRPSVVIALDGAGKGKASCRSIPEVNIVEALGACEDLLVRFGGHHMAAGLEIEVSRIPAFRKRLNRIIREHLENRPPFRSRRVDAEADVADLEESVLEALEGMKPFGPEMPEPTWCFRGVQLEQIRILKDRHLKCQVVSGRRQVDAIGFDMADLQTIANPVDVIGTPELNCWRGQRTPQLRLLGIRAAARSS